MSIDSDTFFYHIKKKDVKWITRRFQILNEIIWRHGNQSQQLKNPKFEFIIHCNAAIDTTAWLTYPKHRIPDKRNRYFKGVKPEKGTFWGYEFLVLSIVDHGRRFTIGASPILPGSDIKNLTKELLTYAKQQRIKLDSLLAEKGFYIDVIREMLDNLRINYLMPVIRDNAINKILKQTPNIPCGITDFKHGHQHTPMNLLIVESKGCKDKNLKFVFSTNKELKDESDIEKITSLYQKRWGTETTFRVQKEDYLPKTTLKDFKIRLFYFLYCCLMYNLWFLVDRLVWIEIHDDVDNYRIVTSKMFRCIFKKIISDPG